MISKMISDKELRDATAMVRTSMLESLPKEMNVEFSEEFDFRVSQLKALHKKTKKQCQFQKRIAAAAAAFFVAMTMLLSFNTEVRAAVVTWFKEIFDTRIVYWFSGEKTDTLPVFEITGLPEDYECIYDEATSNSHNYLYQKEDIVIDGFSFGYSFIQSDAPLSVTFPNEEFTVKQVNINGCPGDLYVSLDPSESHALVWIDETNGVAFTITSFLDPDVILHIAETVQLVK